MSEINIGASGAASIPSKQFLVTDDSKRAFEVYRKLAEYAQSKGLYEFVSSAGEPVILTRPSPDEVGGTTASKAVFDAKTKNAEEQEKSISSLMILYRELISAEAWDLMLMHTRTSMDTKLNPRIVYDKFQKAFCELSADKLYEAQIALQTPYMLGTSLVQFIMKHATTRGVFELSKANTPQPQQVAALKLALHALYVDNSEATARVESDHLTSIADADSFAAYVQILLQRERAGAFRKQTDPLLHPSVKLSVVKEASRARDEPKSFATRCTEAKGSFGSYPLDSDCPVHKSRSKSGHVHKWRECSLRTGVKRDFSRGSPDGK